MLDEVKKITIELQRPMGSFPGRVAIGHYVVVDQHVVLTDADGKPINGSPKRYVGPDGDAKILACIMLRERSRGTAKSGALHRPLQYGRDWKGV